MSGSDYGFSDPRASDPRASDPRDYQRPEAGRDPGGVNSMWGWIAAAVFVGAVLLFVFASGSSGPQKNGVSMPPTASAPPLPGPQKTPTQTTGAAPSTPAPARSGSGH
jgi:hypothetical protein